MEKARGILHSVSFYILASDSGINPSDFDHQVQDDVPSLLTTVGGSMLGLLGLLALIGLSMYTRFTKLNKFNLCIHSHDLWDACSAKAVFGVLKISNFIINNTHSRQI